MHSTNNNATLFDSQEVLRIPTVHSNSELTFLLKELIACECVELALIVATVTLELSVLNFLLAKHPHYLKQFLQMLQVQPGAYQQLRQLVRNPNQH